MMSNADQFFARAEALLDRLEALLPPPLIPPAWDANIAFLWQRVGYSGRLVSVGNLPSVGLDDLQCIDRQKQQIDLNTRQFLHKLPANNVLLWGPRGTGKSSLIKALLNAYAADGLRLIEVYREHLAELPEIVDVVRMRPERFLIFCDDLSFEANDLGYKPLKVVLDGSIKHSSDNVLIYATSNRRHLLPEHQRDNELTTVSETEIHYGEAVEERISLSERFGLWVAFHPFSQEQYLTCVAHWLKRLGVENTPEVRQAALPWALAHGSRSGRSAWQFACDWAGKKGLGL